MRVFEGLLDREAHRFAGKWKCRAGTAPEEGGDWELSIAYEKARARFEAEDAAPAQPLLE